MAFSYTAGSGANRDRLRLLIGDTSSSSYIFEDAELDDFLAVWSGDLQLAAAQAIRTIAVDRAKLAISYSVNGFSMNRGQVASLLLQAADRMEAAAKSVPFEFESLTDYMIDSAGRDQSSYADTGGSG